MGRWAGQRGAPSVCRLTSPRLGLAASRHGPSLVTLGAHSYFIAASWNDWELVEMTKHEFLPDTFFLEIDQSVSQQWDCYAYFEGDMEYGAEFQIVVDSDWEHVIHPAEPHTKLDSTGKVDAVADADGEGHGLNWFIDGMVADTLRIQLLCQRNSSGYDVYMRGSDAQDSIPADASSSYKKILTACADSGDWEMALRVLQDMRTWGAGTDSIGLSEGIASCRKQGVWEAALLLLEESWRVEKTDAGPTDADYLMIASLCEEAGQSDLRDELLSEVRDWDDWTASPPRIHIVPGGLWNRQVRRIGGGMRNVISWHGKDELPEAAAEGCWFLPCTDELAVHVATHRVRLQELGWRKPGVGSIRIDQSRIQRSKTVFPADSTG
eukprot:TRINITY_DN29983_c0_g1_i3.p1 TRINITY_DN29983_c0_g1~~TRINITY_DN29983_c0_g1_i3.p1  ORF type:complete len:380 (-),score=57.88 TRINITY_DN29983_c0_g1_i3:8-1147(-)